MISYYNLYRVELLLYRSRAILELETLLDSFSYFNYMFLIPNKKK